MPMGKLVPSSSSPTMIAAKALVICLINPIKEDAAPARSGKGLKAAAVACGPITESLILNAVNGMMMAATLMIPARARPKNINEESAAKIIAVPISR